MKKGQIYEGYVERLDFPNKAIVRCEEEIAVVKNAIPGQKVSFMVSKKRKGKVEGRLLEVLEKAPYEVESSCPHFGECGGCNYQNLPYEEQLKFKQKQVVVRSARMGSRVSVQRSVPLGSGASLTETPIYLAKPRLVNSAAAGPSMKSLPANIFFSSASVKRLT